MSTLCLWWLEGVIIRLQIQIRCRRDGNLANEIFELVSCGIWILWKERERTARCYVNFPGGLNNIASALMIRLFRSDLHKKVKILSFILLSTVMKINWYFICLLLKLMQQSQLMTFLKNVLIWRQLFPIAFNPLIKYYIPLSFQNAHILMSVIVPCLTESLTELVIYSILQLSPK